MKEQGLKMLHNGAPIADDADNVAELVKAMRVVLDLHLSLWRQLGMMPDPVPPPAA